MKFKINNKFLLFIVIIIFYIKIFLFIVIKNDILSISLGGGNDADYYNGYAIGYFDLAVNIWPVILRYLYNIGLYSREIISYIFVFINLLIIPLITNKISGLSFQKHQEYYLLGFLIYLVYPTIFIYTFDIYRDVFMVLVFLLSCWLVKFLLVSNKNIFSSLFLFLISVLMGLLLLGLRPYLGYAFLLALFLWKINLTKKRLALFAILYSMLLFIANYVGLFEALTVYRGGFEDIESGSTLGLDFSNPIMFIPNFILSMLGQLFGLYITNPLAMILFFIETVPFIFMLIYIVRNIKLADSFIRFLVIFFVLYASVWLIGNDNLGTALRLRFYNYFSVYICFFYILRLKKLYLKK